MIRPMSRVADCKQMHVGGGILNREYWIRFEHVDFYTFGQV